VTGYQQSLFVPYVEFEEVTGYQQSLFVPYVEFEEVPLLPS
jgi:hypothetical protein